MKRAVRIFSLALALSLLCLFVACSPAYRDEPRIGTYVGLGADGERVVYRLTLAADGTGTLTHYPVIGGETAEDIIFAIDGEELRLHGTAVTGGVIGRSEYYGILKADSDFSFEMYSAETGVPLALFVREK